MIVTPKSERVKSESVNRCNIRNKPNICKCYFSSLIKNSFCARKIFAGSEKNNLQNTLGFPFLGWHLGIRHYYHALPWVVIRGRVKIL
jgi:hypothetical protein